MRLKRDALSVVKDDMEYEESKKKSVWVLVSG
jgi:hypothetical protein